MTDRHARVGSDGGGAPAGRLPPLALDAAAPLPDVRDARGAFDPEDLDPADFDAEDFDAEDFAPVDFERPRPDGVRFEPPPREPPLRGLAGERRPAPRPFEG